jgi:hypothetical protein
VDAQNAQIWTASVVFGIEPESAQNGGYLKSSVDNAWWEGISAA